MPRCSVCKLNRTRPCGPQASNDNQTGIIVACDDELLRPPHFARMAVACNNLGFSRYAFVEELAGALYSNTEPLLWPEGDIYTLNDTAIDRAFNGDLSFRWLSDFFRVRHDPVRRPQRSLTPRLRLVDTYFLIKRPNIARHFYR